MNFTIEANGQPCGYFNSGPLSGKSLIKIFLVMKLIILLLTVFCVQASAGALAQEVTLNEKNAPLEKVMQAIRKQTGYAFIFDTQYLKNARPVSVNLKSEGIVESLKAIFDKQPFNYEVKGNTIVLTPKEKSLIERFGDYVKSITINGKVTNGPGEPLPGVGVKLKGTDIATTTGTDATFRITVPDENAVLIFSFVGYQSQELVVKNNLNPTVVLKLDTIEISAVNVFITGYQALPKERATGSFTVIDNKMLNRRVSANILDRLDGITSGVIFNNTNAFTGISTTVNNNKLGIKVRGTSTLSPSLVGADPLVVLDNFPFEGDLRNINPNDVESITVLKDAAAASIWGARAGNGVIVIITKKGVINQKPKVEFNSNVTIVDKPNLSYDKNFLNSSDFIDIETYLFNQKYFDTDLANTTDRPPVSPVVELLAQQRSLAPTDITGRAQIDEQINSLRGNDIRNDFNKYVYQKAIRQQYSLGIRGGNSNLAYALSAGYDKNRENLIRNGSERITINSNNTYTPIKNLDINVSINYSQSKVQMNNQQPYGAVVSGGKYGQIPYLQLADASGDPLSVLKGNRTAYVDSIQQLGFVDQHYSPLNEISDADNSAKINDLILKASATYRIAPFLNAQVLYQNEHQVQTTRNYQSQQSYYTSSLINKFSQYNTATKTFTYPFPLGGILDLGNYTLNADNFRTQINYNKTFNQKHIISALAGAEVRQSVTTGYARTSYGYDDQFGTSVSNLNYNTSYTTNPNGSATISSFTNPSGSVSELTYRFISYFANAGYTYDNRYTATVSGRKDGANIFGANTNDRITPLWSAGLGWNISKEAFYNAEWLPYLKLRTSYGYSGNVYNGSAYSTGTYLTSTATGLQYINGLTSPNPDLRWEKVKNINAGIDFSTKSNVLSGTIELYQKQGLELIETVPLAASSGFTSFNGNAASTKTKGIDVTLNSKNTDGKFKWYTTVLFNHLNDKVTKYDVTQTATSIQTLSGVALLGKPIYSLFSYRWAGLDATNGDPQGYLNGGVSKNYTGIINNFNPDSLVYNGSAVPPIWGALRNDFTYRGFTLSVNITYKFGYYFRRPSVSLNYTDMLSGYANTDYGSRWQKPGDESITNIPSLVYSSNSGRNTFYQYSEELVQEGDHIRLQDIGLSYDLTKKLWRNMPFSGFQIYGYANNLGILWRANSFGLDPDALPPTLGGHTLKAPFSIAFGIKATL